MKPEIFKKPPTEKQLQIVDAMLELCNIKEEDLPDIDDRYSVSEFISKYMSQLKFELKMRAFRNRLAFVKAFKEIDAYMQQKYDLDEGW